MRSYQYLSPAEYVEAVGGAARTGCCSKLFAGGPRQLICRSIGDEPGTDLGRFGPGNAARRPKLARCWRGNGAVIRLYPHETVGMTRA